MDRGSGTDAAKANDPQNRVSNTFDRLYGLIHGHFGAMDYFYTKFNLPGTTDFYLKLNGKINSKFSVKNDLHAFFNSADVFDPEDGKTVLDPFLGMENDLSLTYIATKDVKITLGHSIFFKSNSLDKTVFNGTKTKDNQFLFCVLIINPTLFSADFNK